MDRDFTDYEWYETPPRERWIKSHLFVRTKLPIRHSDDDIDALANDLPDQTKVLMRHDQELQWVNGLVLSIYSTKPTRDLEASLRESLSRFDAWSLIDEDGEVVEGPLEGPMSLHFKGVRRNRYAQLFVQFRTGTDPDEIVERLKTGLYKSGTARPAFYFGDGRVLFIETSDPIGIIRSRIEREIPRLYRFTLCDTEGRTWSPDRSCGWGSFFES